LLAELKEYIKTEIPFVCYRKPGQQKISVLIAEPDGIQFLADYNQLDQAKGFVFHPFHTSSSQPAIFITPSLSFSFELNNTVDHLEKPKENVGKSNLPSFNPLQHHEIKNNYISGFNTILSSIQQGVIQKAVLSRMEFVPGIGVDQAPDILIKLFHAYPSAFVYLLFLPGQMVWIGATPEILLEKKNCWFRTIALAGTKVENTAGEIIWTDKEKHEQEFVCDYIEDVLHGYDVSDYKKSQTYTVQAGNVFHLRTDFEFNDREKAVSFGKLASQLHPTPAICGLPKEQAYEIIAQVEKHNREFYSGFLGPVNLDEESNLYVNLRCLQFFDGGIAVYTGGGITKGSEIEKEWEETVQKAGTLLALLKKM
jgi:isochorismate synthase